jgi:thioredoxin/glutathione reductase (selenoprotein)
MTKEGTLFATGNNDVDFDLVVIGGGSGGLSCAKEAAKLGWKVACCDFVKPSPPGTTWGLGGTCVNVGCIPKKLMHQASLLGESLKDAETFGWEYGSADKKPVHNWEKMVENIQVHIKSLNWGYKVQLREKKVNYLNELAAFKGLKTLEMTDKKGKKREVTASNIVVAVGGRPKYPDIPGAIEYGITSDDIFSLRYNPGSTLIVGASYIALECAGFLKGLGIDVTVMVRSIYLRGFDQQMAEKIGDYMEAEGVNFIRPCVPTKVEQVEAGSPGKVKVYGEYKDGTEYCNEFNTVVFAIGRTADTDGLNLGTINVKTNASSKKIEADDNDRSTVPNIYAIGDVIEGRPELTPVAIQAGRLLARRIIGASKITTDYDNVATTVFTPIEYGCVGLSEEDAIQTLGEDAVEVYHSSFWPLEWTVTHRPENACYAKLVVNKQDDERVVGFHYLGPNAGEITQAFAGMVKLRATMADFEGLVGIHPTCAEIFTTMSITKSSGIDASASGC